MKYENIADIYSANKKIRENLSEILASISTEEASALPDGEKWSIAQIIEHVSMVENGAMRICSKLLVAGAGAGQQSDGTFALSDSFRGFAAQLGGKKLEAPDRVQPVGNVAIVDSLEKMAASRTALENLQEDFEKYDNPSFTFPHPYFGELTAAEWLVIVGLHEHRHTSQIEKLLQRVRQEKTPG